MSLIEKIKGVTNRDSGASAVSKDVLQTTKNWFNDRNEFVLVQRNLSYVAVMVLTVTVAIMVLAATYYLQNSRTIEPFVIEIEPKTGVATVVDPKSLVAYMSDESVIRSEVWSYVQNRHEYFSQLYNRQFEYIRTHSSPQVYANFRALYAQGNPQSPIDQYGTNSTRSVELKTLILVGANIAEVRFTENTRGTYTGSVDKFARVSFAFGNLDLNPGDRLLNPLNFNVTEYQVTDERN
jgi:type IV secretion system protein VirB8